MDHLPLDLVSRILSFLDGETLLTCASVCKDFCQLTDQRSYWENAAWRLFPHLKETYDIMPYNGDWKALFKDRNRRNRSAVFEWTVADFLSNPERRYSPSFRVENYNFKVIVDPVGNPNVYFLEPGVSVYLACSLASPTSSSSSVNPSLLGPMPGVIGAEELVPPPPGAAGLGLLPGANGGFDNAANGIAPLAMAAAAAAAVLPPGVDLGTANAVAANAAAAASAAAAEWECCCAFSLTACNQQRKGRNVTWHSSMLNDRFHKNRKNWGVHSLLPLTKLKDPASGFVVDDSLKLKVRLRLLYLTVKVVRTSSLAAHQGFGVVDTATDGEDEKDNDDAAAAAAEDSNSQTLTYELFHCTTLAMFKELLVRDLGLPSPEHLRLWVFTQPWPDTVLCPREILVNETNSTNAPAAQAGGNPPNNPNPNNNNANPAPANNNNNNNQNPPPANANPNPNPNTDDDLSSPTLFSLLQLHMDGLGVARVWAECSGDGGFSSSTSSTTTASAPFAEEVEEEDKPRVFDPAADAAAALARSLAAKEEEEESNAMLVPGLHRYQEAELLSSVPLWPDSRDLSSQQAAQSAAASPSSDMNVLVFLKWMEPVSGRVAYLTHAVVKVHTPLHHLFALVSKLVQQPGHLLGAHVETTPANWQPGAHSLYRSLSCPPKPLCVGGDRMQEGGASGGQMTLRDAGVENGQILTFHLASMEEALEDVYRGYLEELFQEAGLMYYGADPFKAQQGQGQQQGFDASQASSGSGASSVVGVTAAGAVGVGVGEEDDGEGRGGQVVKGQVEEKGDDIVTTVTTVTTVTKKDASTTMDSEPAALISLNSKSTRRRRRLQQATLRLEDVVNLFERFGYQSFRVRNVYYQHKHMNARQTLEYVIQGRHLGFCCDRCGATDFTGPRYKCLSCYDYDLCGNCQEHPQAAAHRYKYEHRGWRRENHFGEHNKTHNMHMILPVPCKLNLLQR